MSLSSVRPLARQILDGLGYSEWTDGFNSENIPSTILDGTYFLNIGSISASAANQATHEFDYPLEIRLFFKGYRDPREAIDAAVSQSDNIIGGFLTESVRLTQEIRDITLTSLNFEPLDASNDNSIIVVFNFSFKILNCY